MKPYINLFHLKLFCDTVLYNSVSEAANNNFVTQSAVSQAITKLEKILEAELTAHTKQKLQITEDGKILFEQARHIFKALQNAQDKINQNKGSITGTIKFVSINSLGMSFLPPIFQKMQSAYPHLPLNFRFGGPNFIRNALRQEEAEFAIIVFNREYENYNKHSLKKGLFNLYHNPSVIQSNPGKGIFVDHNDGLFVQDLCDHLSIDNHSFIPPTEVAAWEVIARFTEMGMGIGFFPDYITNNNRYPQLKKYPIDIPPFEYEIAAVYNKGAKLSRASRLFIEQFYMESADE
jgi:DNA-binding transcriptional LysR family regulator